MDHKQIQVMKWVAWKLEVLRRETENFTLDPYTLSEFDVATMMNVGQDFIDFLPHLFGFFKPQHHTDLRRAISYLNGFHHAQREAWERLAEQWRNDRELLKKITETTDPDERRQLIYTYCDGSK